MLSEINLTSQYIKASDKETQLPINSLPIRYIMNDVGPIGGF